MIAAALDTSIGSSFALSAEGRTLCSEFLDTRDRESEKELVPWLRGLLREHGMVPGNVAAWTLGTGPGSFTGLRVGIALAKGMALQTAAAYRGIPSSIGLARMTAERVPACHRIGILHDGRREQLILTVYERSEDRLSTVEPAAIASRKQMLATCQACDILATLQPEPVRQLLPAALAERLQVFDHLDAAMLLDPGGWPWPGTREGMEESCRPVYVRPPVFVKPTPPRTR